MRNNEIKEGIFYDWIIEKNPSKHSLDVSASKDFNY